MLYPKDPAVKVVRDGRSLEFSLRRSTSDVWGAIAIFVIPTAFFLAILLSPRSDGAEPPPTGLIVVLGLFAACMGYWGLTTLVNVRRIKATSERLVSSFGPLPAIRPVVLEANRLKQLFSVASGTRRGQTVFGNVLYAMDKDDHVHILVAGLPSFFAANQIAHELEDFYGIEDMPVYGVTTDPTHPGPRIK